MKTNELYLKFTKTQIEERIALIGHDITLAYREPLHLIGLLKGCEPFLHHLAEHIHLPLTFDYIHTSSYLGTVTPTDDIMLMEMGELHIDSNSNILVVDDIIDRGKTAEVVGNHLQECYKPKSLALASVIFRNQSGHLGCYERFHYCFSPSYKEFFVGYGMDLDEHYRELSNIYTLKHRL